MTKYLATKIIHIMRKLIFSIFLVSIFFSASGQLHIDEPVSKTTVGKVAGAELYYEVKDQDTTYTLLFRNAEYSSIVDYAAITWQSAQGETEALYNLFMSVFKDENKKNKNYKVEFKLGTHDAVIRTERGMGMTYLWLWTDAGYTTFGQEQIKRLFGK
jgi:hypothetical protein